ncbi:hypothetical protein PHLCEN_2v10341 [Hermanssonia centrifuga]|uniref:Uncharacterized protein n=1 Tax=Hermanssonia centrifuga TaxID=98765 RepID=A0A2R6NN57_9APHY|nr:hypothetical protein PHLCEN_2v10344 [Hermanssonia centrifuga]PSR73831.1 hypothetical protein PHLCEN_2v10341 [Hermanssonia centrifuga]
MVNTRPANATAHPGQVALAPKRKRRTAAEMKAVRDAEDSAKAVEAEKLTHQQQMLVRIAELEAQVQKGAGAGPVHPPNPAKLIAKGQLRGAQLPQHNLAAAEIITPKSSGKPAKEFMLAAEGGTRKLVKKTRAAGKYSRADVAAIRAALSSPTPNGARQTEVMTKRKAEDHPDSSTSSKKMKGRRVSGIQVSAGRDGPNVVPGGKGSKGKGKLVGSSQSTIQTATADSDDDDDYSNSSDEIQEFDDFSDDEFGEEMMLVKMEENDPIVISDDEDDVAMEGVLPQGGNVGEAADKDRQYGHRMTTQGMVYIVDESSEEELAPDDILPWSRATGMRGRRFTQEDLPIPRDLHKIFVRLYIRRVIGWLGDQAAAFSLCGVDLLPAMRTAWDKTFLDHPHDILTRGAVYYITLQKIYEWRSVIGRLGINLVVEYFRTRTDLVTALDRKIYVEEMVKDGSLLPFVYARTKLMPDGEPISTYSLYVITIADSRFKMKSVGIFQGPLILQGLATHLRLTTIPGEPRAPNAYPIGALAIVATAIERGLTGFRSGDLTTGRIYHKFGHLFWGR